MRHYPARFKARGAVMSLACTPANVPSYHAATEIDIPQTYSARYLRAERLLRSNGSHDGNRKVRRADVDPKRFIR